MDELIDLAHKNKHDYICHVFWSNDEAHPPKEFLASLKVRLSPYGAYTKVDKILDYYAKEYAFERKCLSGKLFALEETIDMTNQEF